jgi:Tfp pilus assembly protein PilF
MRAVLIVAFFALLAEVSLGFHGQGLAAPGRGSAFIATAPTAGRYYEQALKRDPDRAVAAANLGVFYASRGMVREAVDLWRTAFQKNPQLSEIGVNLGRELCEIGDAEGARAALQRVLTHNPDFPVARQALADVAQSGCPRK